MEDSCPLRTLKPTKILFSEIETFLNKSVTVKKLDIVYYNSDLKEVFKNHVFTKKVSDTCNLLFTKLGDFYYFYNGILASLDLLWKSSGTKARLGNHITVGMDKRGWNIHETVYSTNVTSKRFYYIVKKEPSVYFRVVNKGQSIKPIISGSVSKLNTQSIWNELICGIVSGSRFGTKSASAKKKKAVKLKIKKNTPKLKNVVLSISRLRLKKDEIAVYRIRRNKRINLKHLNKNILFIHTNNFTYIIINIHYEPEDLDEYL
jgi:hypothetical protein